MDPPLSLIIERIAQKGRTQFSKWDMPLFQDYCRATLPHLMSSSQASETSQPVAAAFAELLCEGIGRGYLATNLNADPVNLMEYCLRDWLVLRLPEGTTEQRIQLLASAWNMLEGLLREPRWVNTYVMARVRELENDGDLQVFLTHVLKPLFEPA